MVVEQVVGVLAQHGVEPIPVVGEVFDPAVHEAIQQVASDEHEPMTVIEEVEAGFRLGERLVRPAKVIVAMAAVETTEDVGEADDSDKSDDEAGQKSEEN